MIDAINQYVHDNLEKFTSVIFNEKKGNRVNCPFCGKGHTDKTLSYNTKKRFWRCFRENCGVNSLSSFWLYAKVKKGDLDYTRMTKAEIKNIIDDVSNLFVKQFNITNIKDIKLDDKIQYHKNATLCILDCEELSKQLKAVNEKEEKIIIFKEYIKDFPITLYESILTLFVNNGFNKFIQKVEDTHTEIIVIRKQKMFAEIYCEFLANKYKKSTMLKIPFKEKDSIMKRNFEFDNWKRFENKSCDKFKILKTTKNAPKFLNYYHFYSILDEYNRIVGMQGRLKSDNELTKSELEFKIKRKNDNFEIPKCYNFSNFQKSKVVYGLNRMKDSYKGLVIVHEGPADVIRASEFGLFAISCLGKDMSDYQSLLIKKYIKDPVRIVVFLDNDEAGKRGMKRIAQKLLDVGYDSSLIYVCEQNIVKDAYECKDVNQYLDCLYKSKRYMN